MAAMPRNKSRRFITLEGGEGTGKSTLQSGLFDALFARRETVILTREPGGTPLAEMVRNLALHPPDGQTWSPLAEALLMNAARADHLEKVIRPALQQNHWVICDRFADSTLAYQSANGGVSQMLLKYMEDAVLGDTRPDLTIILDAGPETTLARRAERNETADAFEARDDGFHKSVRDTFLKIAHADPDRCVVIDAQQSAERVLKECLAIIECRFMTPES
jgi:dTMP kinase